MWPEPLSADARQLDEHTVDVVALDGRGAEVARVRCAYNARAGCGALGEMRVVDERGAPAQRLRALVLMVREALRFGAGRGIRQVWTEAPGRMAPLARRISGLAGAERGGRLRFDGELHAVRTHALRSSDAHGRLVVDEGGEEGTDGAVDLLR
ncbi:MAG TPA: hypothetical protein VNM91_08050 [Dehalococcoidia bacterium]|nr:hypothetical protein [Dehalococcoidia bacterium]